MHRNGHILLVHHSESERMRYVADWFGAGLVGDDKLLYVDVADRGIDSLVTELTRRGLGADRALRQKRLEFVSLDDLLQLDVAGGVLERALTDSTYPAVRIAVRGDAVLQTIGAARHRQVEQSLGRLAHRRRLSVLCQYDGRTTSGEDLTTAVDLHPDWVYEADLSMHRRHRVIQVDGLLDTFDGEVLSRSLERMTRDLSTEEELVLDLRLVEALTVGAGRALVTGSQVFRDRGGRVRCGIPSGAAGRLLRRVLPDADAGFEVVHDVAAAPRS